MRKASWSSPRARCSTCSPASARACSWSIARGRIVWVNDGYKRFLPALGFSSVDQFVGHMVEDVMPNTQMRRVLETGQPILIDLLTNRAGTFVVSRIPLRDESDER